MSVYPEIDAPLRRFIEEQHLFFIGTAPSGPEGRLNISPKGIGSLCVLGPQRVAYADYTGSGVETIAHLRENGRIVIMLCAFTGPPRVVRLHGRGEAVEPQDSGFSELVQYIGVAPNEPPLRSIIRVAVERISDSCGYGVPLYQFEGDRAQLSRWASNKGPAGLREYQRDKNSLSIDGLKGLRWTDATE